MNYVHTPTPDIADLLKRLQDVLDLHLRHDGRSASEDAYCDECLDWWPCRTRKAAEGKA